MAIHIATMYLLDWRGRVIQQQFCEYHSCEWMMFVSLGWITHTVDVLKIGEA